MLTSLIQDPPPLLVVELDADGITAVRRDPRASGFEARADRPLEPGVLDPAPTRPNITDSQALTVALGSALEEIGPIKRSEAALILPDASSRLTVLDFDALPNGAEERLKLIRARLAKSVPFDIEAARIAYQLSKVESGYSALVALTPAEIVRQYEQALVRLGFWPGHVALSMASALNLLPEGGMTLLAKLSSGTLTMAAVESGSVRLIRTVELGPTADRNPDQMIEDMLGDLYPTQVYIADHLGRPVEELVLGGFGELTAAALERFGHELGCAVEPLRSTDGPVGPRDGGIWGYLSLQ